MVNRFQKIDRLSNRRLWISRVEKGSLSAWSPCFERDRTSTAHVFCRKRHVCARWCRSASPCAPARTGNFFAIVFHSHVAPKRTNHKKSEIAKSQFENFENSRSSKLKICREKISNRLRFNKPRSFSSQSSIKLQSSCFTVRRLPTHSHKDVQRGLLHLNSAPNEATTSIMAESHGDVSRSEREQ
jgi:hypothetical protein